MPADLTLSQASAILRAAKLRDGEHRPTPVTAQALVRRGYAVHIGGGGRIRLTDAGWNYARTGERLPLPPKQPGRVVPTAEPLQRRLALLDPDFDED